MRWFLLLLFCGSLLAKPVVTVSSKIFTESYLLGEIISQVIEQAGELEVKRRFGLGDSGFVFEALKTGEIDFYAEYTGTISYTLLKNPKLKTEEQIRKTLGAQGITISNSLGFNNTYAIAVREEFAKKNNLVNIGDLNRLSKVKATFTSAFLEREDSYPLLKRAYGLNLSQVRGMEHTLTYEALKNGETDVIDIYSTDAKLSTSKITLLKDNRSVFPKYYGVIIARKATIEKYPRTWEALRTLEGRFTDKKMAQLNAEIEIQKKSFAEVAAVHLGFQQPITESKWAYLLEKTKEHLWLVFVAVALGILVAVPLGYYSKNYPAWGQALLLITGLFQTIPALALLCLLIPLFGIGMVPSLVALFLYALLPIARNTLVGFQQIDSTLLEVGKALGLTPYERFKKIEFPLALPMILAGVKTATIISVGTATLAALIGAGGYGEPIVRGLALHQYDLIFLGALPAAGLALILHVGFEGLDRLLGS